MSPSCIARVLNPPGTAARSNSSIDVAAAAGYNRKKQRWKRVRRSLAVPTQLADQARLAGDGWLRCGCVGARPDKLVEGRSHAAVAGRAVGPAAVEVHVPVKHAAWHRRCGELREGLRTPKTHGTVRDKQADRQAGR